MARFRSTPTPAVGPGHSPKGELGAVLASLHGVVLSLALFSCAINLLLLTPAICMLQVYDRVLTSRNEVTLAALTLIVLRLFLLDALLEFVRSRVLVRASNPAQALGDLTGVRHFATSQGLFAFFDAPWTPIYIAVIFLLSPWLSLFALVAALLLALVALATARFTTPPRVSCDWHCNRGSSGWARYWSSRTSSRRAG